VGRCHRRLRRPGARATTVRAPCSTTASGEAWVLTPRTWARAERRPGHRARGAGARAGHRKENAGDEAHGTRPLNAVAPQLEQGRAWVHSPAHTDWRTRASSGAHGGGRAGHRQENRRRRKRAERAR
jgi:hypothetical protein